MSAHPSYVKVFAVLDALTSLGPGLHSPTKVAEACINSLAERQSELAAQDIPLDTISYASVQRVLQAGHRKQFLNYERGRYGLPGHTLGRYTAAHQDHAPQLPVALPGGPLTHECMLLQRATSQAVTVYVPVMIDTPPSRQLKHHDIGRRSDFVRCLDEPTVRAILLQAPFGHDAAGLVMQAHLNTKTISARLRLIRSQGYAATPSPLPGWDSLAAPLWHGTHVIGSLAIHTRANQRYRHSAYLTQLMNSAARLSAHCDYSAAHSA